VTGPTARTLAHAHGAPGLPLLDLAGLTVRLEVNGTRRAVLREVSLAVRAGEAVGLVGESGSGKTMTARAIGRLLPRGAEVTGSIRFGGADVGGLAGAHLRGYRGQVAMIFQDPRARINPVRRIGDLLTEALRANQGMSAARARARAVDMLGRVGVGDGAARLRQYPHQMSGGILQRVMIAAALLTGPRLLLADEPTTALDTTTQAEVMALLDGLRRGAGLAMLFITHDLDLAAAVCDRTIVMYAGQIVEVRDSALLHGDPLHPYTAALAAARPDITRAVTGCGRSRGARCRPTRRRRANARSRRAARTWRMSAAPRRPASPNWTAGCPAAPAPPNCAAAFWRHPVAEHGPRHPVPGPGGAPAADSGATPVPGPGGAPVLEAAGLRKEFGELAAVAGVSLRLLPVRCLAIVGESGAGKTTIARMLVGLERPTGGTISACGHDRSRPARSARDRRRGAVRCRSCSRTPTRAWTRARVRRPRWTRCCGCTTDGRPPGGVTASPN
jgi:ABC-type glutathione transport system ATPase component